RQDRERGGVIPSPSRAPSAIDSGMRGSFALSRFCIAPRFAALAAAAAAVLALSGCGYRPVYGEQSAAVSGDGARSNLGSVKVLGIADRRGQILRNYLLDRMTPRGEPATPRYILSVTTTEGRR